MAICGDKERVFEVEPVFKAENSFTHRHLYEFVGLDVEMEIMKHYYEVMDIVDKLFVTLFDHLNEKCKKELDAVCRQHPYEPLKDHYLALKEQMSQQEEGSNELVLRHNCTWKL